ncbi:Prenylated Rab acceptor protein 1 [Conoideocrella luteorostrata]|uniref:Prenylated Rab acceptor protein 1 n=1 Tax=Conoideocrella luteorostrata TaxID=1105319 RepID=A0AAJ0G3A6_9HYPO|nr:Prenylated Rab acceptor protein 1 [Conoideocrella luteorostrata]
MKYSAFSTALLLSPALASPVDVRASTPTLTIAVPIESTAHNAHKWAAGWKTDFPIHESCNSSLRAQLQQGLDESVKLAQHARDHLLRWGHESKQAQKYFGNTTAHAIGWYDRIISADKSAMLFRCDDPDKNCATQKGWAGHWRGSNATTQTVICPLSFEIRRPLSAVCNGGYTVTGSKLNTYWATDLMHRMLHVPAISEGLVDHYAHDYSGILELAKKDPAKSGIDSDTLQYFAIDVWAYDIAAPGVGCTGKPPKESSSSTAQVASSTSTAKQASSSTTAAHSPVSVLAYPIR